MPASYGPTQPTDRAAAPTTRRTAGVLRAFDIAFALAGLILLSPLLVAAMLLVWLHDRASPLYIAQRMGRGGVAFRMVKLRSMVVDADRSGVQSTATTDPRVTPIGHVLRRTKLDEVAQLWNVLSGDMSLVGPRPNVLSAVARYTDVERRLLTVRPGMTDLASIVFSDEGDILAGADDPELRYEQIIRPWKSRLALVYVDRPGVGLYLKLILWTAVAVVDQPAARARVVRELARRGVEPSVIDVARRDRPLPPHPPPGATAVVSTLQ